MSRNVEQKKYKSEEWTCLRKHLSKAVLKNLEEIFKQLHLLVYYFQLEKCSFINEQTTISFGWPTNYFQRIGGVFFTQSLYLKNSEDIKSSKAVDLNLWVTLLFGFAEWPFSKGHFRPLEHIDMTYITIYTCSKITVM